MIECSACGAELPAHETRCPICGKPTAYYHSQRRCLHCGTPAAQQAVTCMMCGKPVDSLPLNTSIFSGSWWGVGLGVLIIVGLVIWITRYQGNPNQTAEAAPQSSSTRTIIPTTPPTITPTPTITSTPIPTATFTPTPTPIPMTYTIKSGDNPSLIADQYGVTVEALLNLNNVTDVSNLQVGQVLVIPSASDTTQAAESQPTPQIINYVIQPGDTLLGIALEYDTTVEAINTANPDTDLNLIFPGQQIMVPLAPPTPTPMPTTPPTPSATPGPVYPAPNLLSPATGQVIDDSTLFFNWTSTRLLAFDEYYVLQLTWANGAQTEVWSRSSSWRISKDQRPANGLITWTVSIMRQTGAKADGSPTGFSLSRPGEQRPLEWR